MVMICYMIWPCDIAVRITYLISHSSCLSCHTVIEEYFYVGCIKHLKALVLRTRASRAPAAKNLMMYGKLYQHTQVVLY